MGCAKRGAANGHYPWQAERQSRPPGKPRPIRVVAKCGVCVVALLGFVVPATTFVARLASIRILPATQFAEDLIRGSLVFLAALNGDAKPFNAAHKSQLGDADLDPGRAEFIHNQLCEVFRQPLKQ